MKTKSIVEIYHLRDALAKLQTAKSYLKDGGEPNLTNKLGSIINDVNIIINQGSYEK